MPESYHVVPVDLHNALIEAAYRSRGYTEAESGDAARFCALAAAHGIRTHNGIKSLHLDERLGSGATPPGCIPGAAIEKKESKFPASEVWNANRKLGQSVAFAAMDTCMKLADRYGIAQVSVDNAFHYLWGGGYVMDAAKKGYIAYTNCTAALAEVVPFMGKSPTLGTNPHSWGFPTAAAVGFPIVIDWATSVIAMGRVQQFQREKKEIPPNCAVDADGQPTTDPEKVAALLPFGAHKGYGLALINEIVSAFIGGSIPTIRNRPERTSEKGEKTGAVFYFQVIHPDALSSGTFAMGRDQAANVKAVIENILGPGNEDCLLPGQIEANAASDTEKAGGLLFNKSEIGAFNEIAAECGLSPWDASDFPVYEA